MSSTLTLSPLENAGGSRMANTSLGGWCHFSFTRLFLQCDWDPNTAKVRRGLISPLTYPHELVWKKNLLIFTLVMPFPQIKIIVFPPYLRSYQPPYKTQHVWRGRIISWRRSCCQPPWHFAKRRDAMLVPLLPFCIQGSCICLCLPPLVKTPNESLPIIFHSPDVNKSHLKCAFAITTTNVLLCLCFFCFVLCARSAVLY